MTLREILHAHLPTLTAASTVRDAVDKMDIYQFPGLVMVDDEMRPIGLLMEGDLCRAVNTRDNLVEMGSELVQVYCTREPTVAEADLEISEAFHKMLSGGLKLLPVVEEERLLGIVLRVDLMQAMLLDASKTS